MGHLLHRHADRCAAAVALALALPCAPAQTASLLADVNAIQTSPGSFPDGFTQAGGATVFFAATTGQVGRELFATQGLHETPAATRLLRDIRPGPEGSSPRSLTAVGELLFFVADDGIHGFELWKSDGTTAGTVLVADLRPGSAGAEPQALVAALGVLFFTCDDGVRGREVWRSDGTAGGTRLVADVQPGPSGSRPVELVAAGSRLFFSADDGVHGIELWKSDGTAAGTALVRDIRPGGGHGAPWRVTSRGNSVVFAANDGQTGFEPWASDGTAAGTVPLADIAPGSADSSPTVLRRVGDTVFFFARYAELWRTDGTPAGTRLVGSTFGTGRDGVALGQVLIFASQGNNSSALWRSDGTAAGTFQLAAPGWFSHGLTELRTIGQTVWFQGSVNNSASNQGSLWKSDGTPAGTVQVARIRTNAGSIDGGPAGFAAAVDGRVVFGADDGWLGREPWVTDGTAAGTRLLADLETAPGRTLPSHPNQFTDLFGTAVFVADDGSHGREPWVTDGTSAGTRLLVDARPGAGSSLPYGFARVDRLLFFAADDGAHGTEPWVTDGTPAGTRMVKDLVPGPGPSFAEGFTLFRGEAWFGAANALWRSDGTDPGTASVALVRVGELKAFGDVLLFAGDDPQRGNELWISDGTAPGTRLLVDIDPVVTSRGPLSSSPQDFVEYNGLLFFTAATSRGRDLWQTDGTAAGTAMVLDIEPGTSAAPIELTVAGPRLFFSVGPVLTGPRFLWSSDGTAQGTARVTARAIDPNQLCPLGDRVLFAARDPFQTELWISDGSDAGTHVVRDIHPNGSGSPGQLTAIGTRHVWFQADDGARGNELWVTDGTAAGTRLWADIDPRPVAGFPPYSAGASSPSGFALSAGRLLFSADDGVKGAEPWMLFPGATAQIVGDGCGASQPPSLRVADPALGTVATIAGDRVPANAGAVIVLVAAVPPRPLPVSRPPGCTLYVDPGSALSLAGFVPGGPGWSLPAWIPNDSGLTSLRFGVQAVYLLQGPVPDFALTNGVHCSFGP